MSKQEESSESNPILSYIGEVPIRKTNFVKIKYNEFEYRRLVNISMQLGIPVAKIVALSSQPCTVCGNDHIVLTIPLGVISVNKQKSAESTIKRKKRSV
jgi:hypothetical protein